MDKIAAKLNTEIGLRKEARVVSPAKQEAFKHEAKEHKRRYEQEYFFTALWKSLKAPLVADALQVSSGWKGLGFKP